MLSQVHSVYAMRPGEIVITPSIKTDPFGEAYAIIFPKAQKDEAKTYYKQLLELNKKARDQGKATPAASQESTLDKLKELLDMGVLSEDEYEEKRRELLQLI